MHGIKDQNVHKHITLLDIFMNILILRK